MKSTSKMFKALLGGLLLFISAEFSPAAAQTCTPPPAGMVSWWPGDGNFNDIQDGNDGTTAGAVTFTSGKVGQAFLFDGSPNSFITLPNSPNLLPASNQLTIDTWIKPDFSVANQWDNILAKRDGCGAGGNSYVCDHRVSSYTSASLRRVCGDTWMSAFANAAPHFPANFSLDSSLDAAL